MKTALIVIILIIAALASGRTATAPALSPQETGARKTAVIYPDLTGSWTGPLGDTTRGRVIPPARHRGDDQRHGTARPYLWRILITGSWFSIMPAS